MNSPDVVANDKDSDCGGKWKSKIKGSEEGHFHDLKVDASGNITGKFEGKEIISGHCDETGSHRITLKREDANNTYDYSGKISPEGGNIFTAKGTRTTTSKAKHAAARAAYGETSDKEKLTDPEEWVAEKGT